MINNTLHRNVSVPPKNKVPRSIRTYWHTGCWWSRSGSNLVSRCVQLSSSCICLGNQVTAHSHNTVQLMETYYNKLDIISSQLLFISDSTQVEWSNLPTVLRSGSHDNCVKQKCWVLIGICTTMSNHVVTIVVISKLLWRCATDGDLL